MQELSKGESGNTLTQIVNVLLQWYKNKTNITECDYYINLESE